MLNPNRGGAMIDVDFIPIELFSKLLSLTVGSGSIGTNMEIGLDVDTAAATVEGNAGVTASRELITGAPIQAHGVAAGTPAFGEIGTTGIVGLKMNTAGDAASLFMRLPNKWDTRQRTRYRVIWTTDSTTAADTVDWKLFYASDRALSGTLALPATALDTVIAQSNVLGASAKRIHQTAWGIINGGTLYLAGVYLEYISFALEMDAKAGGLSEDIWALGIEVEHTIRRGRGLQKAARRFVRSQD